MKEHGYKFYDLYNSIELNDGFIHNQESIDVLKRGLRTDLDRLIKVEKSYRDTENRGKAEGRAEGEDRQRILSVRNLIDLRYVPIEVIKNDHEKHGISIGDIEVIYNHARGISLNEAIEHNELHQENRPTTNARIEFIYNVLPPLATN